MPLRPNSTRTRGFLGINVPVS